MYLRPEGQEIGFDTEPTAITLQKLSSKLNYVDDFVAVWSALAVFKWFQNSGVV